MAEEFSEWLKGATEKCVEDKSVLVIGITGKSDSNSNKYGFIERLLESTAFCGRYKEEQTISVGYLMALLSRFVRLRLMYIIRISIKLCSFISTAIKTPV